MKHVLLIIGLCLATTAAFAQKAAVSGAEKMAKDQRSNLNEARNLIKGAMSHADTKDDPKTWNVAGLVEDALFNRENTKQMLGQEYDASVMYQALENELPLFLKAYELDQRPNARGRVTPKFTKNIKGVISSNHIYYINGGSHYLDENNYQKAYDFFEQYLEIANLPFFEGERTAERDENYMMVQFFSGAIATMLNNTELALSALNRAKDTPYRQYDVYNYIINEYQQLEDSVNVEKTLEEGMKIFPDSSFFMYNLINIYIYSDRNEQAVNLLTTAIAQNPTDPQLFHALGNVYESGYEDFIKAEENYKKSLDLNPENSSSLSNLGRIYYNQGIIKLNDANEINDVQEYNAIKEVAFELFRKGLPFFEKAHQIDPDDYDAMVALRGIYYQLSMNEKFNEIEAKMESR